MSNGPSAVRDVIINADDYAMDAGVDAAIVDLARRGVVTAASVMVLSPRWPQAASALAELPISCGLHLDLTSDFIRGHGGRSLSSLIALSYLRVMDEKLIATLIQKQIDTYEQAMRKPPDFVDGHQHVHQLPGIRNALFSVLSQHYGRTGAQTIRVRHCKPRVWRGAKAQVVSAFGARDFGRIAVRRHFTMNSDFAGVYDFNPKACLPDLWRGWLGTSKGSTPLIMCHPALPHPDVRCSVSDPIRQARYREYAWLASAELPELVQAMNFRQAKWPEGST